MTDFEQRRAEMVRMHIQGRGIHSPELLHAMRSVPREAFVSQDLAEFAYEDSPLPIEAGQTISQPFIVAEMIDAADVGPGDRVLEIGAGSGYAAAVLSRLAREVIGVERHDALVNLARERLAQLGYDNVQLVHADGSQGWAASAPYDAILVSAGGPSVPRGLLEQLVVGGRLVIPIGPSPRLQRLVRVVRVSETEYEEADLGAVQFVPLIGAAGWPEELRPRVRATTSVTAISALIRESAEPLEDIESARVDPLLDRIGEARVVLLGEATHGTSEFYRMRARITRELILRYGFRMVAVEADWPDAAAIDGYIRHHAPKERRGRVFSRFPTWMWQNEETLEFIEWLREYNRERRDGAVSFHGLDLYSLHASAAAVIEYLDRVDPAAARAARARYACLSPWEADPATYGRAVLSGAYEECESEVVQTLRDLLSQRLAYAAEHDGDGFLDALQNARLVANAERYYRIMYYGSVASWNLRDQHMVDTLDAILAFRGADSKTVVWAHNSHVGDTRATEMGARGQQNVGSLCRERFGDSVTIVGFGTDHGSVAAASDWDEPMQIVQVRPALLESYEGLFHQSKLEAGMLSLRYPRRDALREELLVARLERAIGVVYRPDRELESHYFQAVLPRQFDEYVWFDRTSAVKALSRERPHGVPDTYPFGL